MARQREKAPAIGLETQLARDLFGWQWQDDWQAWCPPGWPPIRVINAPYLDKRHALERHGGAPWASSGGMDERGRPVIPAYQYDPQATEILWRWLYHQPGVQSVQFVPVPPPPVPVLEAVRWRCEIAHAADHVAMGQGNTHNEALCRAALALAQTQAAPVA